MLHLKMDDLVDGFENLKVSAFSKLRYVNPYVKDITIGPNKSLTEEEEVTEYCKSVAIKPESSSPMRKCTLTNTTSAINSLLADLECQRQERVQEAVNARLSCILEFSKKQRSNSKQELQKQQQMLMSGMQQQELLILQALEQHDKDALVQHQQLLQYYQELAEKRKQDQKELEEREKRRQKLNELLERIKKEQVEFRNVYQEIFNILKNCKFQGQLRDVLGDIPKRMKTIPDGMEEITARCKQGKINENECQKANNLVQEIKGLLIIVKQKVAELNSVEERVVKNEPKLQPIVVDQPKPSLAPYSEAARTEVVTKPPDIKSVRVDKFISKSSLRLYSELQDYLENYMKMFDELMQNNAFKQFKFDCKKAVNIPVNAISAVNTHHLLDKYNRLLNLLTGKTVEVGETRVCATKHPQGVAFCTNLLAKKFVLQGDLMISSNPEAAFCYAAITVALWHDNQDFGKLLLAHFYKQCPYLVPFYPPRAIEQSDEEFYRSQGYLYTDGVVEKQDKFLKRMTGIMRLYAAIIIAKPKRGQQKNMHGLAEGWRWLGAFLNLEPKPDITATMLHVFLEIAGSTLHAAYGKMFAKVMNFVCYVYLPMIQKIDSGGPFTRLDVLLQEYQKQGRFEVPHGMLPSNFW